MKIFFAEHDVIAMHAELAATRERMLNLILVREIAAPLRVYQTDYLRLPEKLAAWKRIGSFDRSEVLTERQRRIRGHVCSVDDPEHSEIKTYFEPRRPLSP